eukprot:1193184-Prorocentrum_minimum.AAC.4
MSAAASATAARREVDAVRRCHDYLVWAADATKGWRGDDDKAVKTLLKLGGEGEAGWMDGWTERSGNASGKVEGEWTKHRGAGGGRAADGRRGRRFGGRSLRQTEREQGRGGPRRRGRRPARFSPKQTRGSLHAYTRAIEG